jgi:DNA-binding NarL/FixJ family response regulator
MNVAPIRSSETAKPDASIAVAVFCTDRVLRERLVKLLREDASVAVADGGDGESDLFHLIDRARPAVLLAHSPPRKWLADWRRQPDPPSLVVLLDDADADGRVDLLGAGAQAILPPSSGTAEIINALKLVASGYFVLPPDLVSQLTAGSSLGRSLPGGEPAGVHLTPRELDVLGAMANGASNKAIARRLGISFHTAKFHVAALLAKLDADSRTEAVTKAAQLGLVML